MTTGDWAEQLRRIERDTQERTSATSAHLQRLAIALSAPSLGYDEAAAAVARFGRQHGTEVYQRLSEAAARYVTGAIGLAASWRDEYLSDGFPSERIAAAGPPPVVPLPPSGADTAEWVAWYQRLSGWVVEQQAWSASLLRLLADGDGGENRAELDRAFIDARLGDYLVKLAELGAGYLVEILAVTDACARALAAEAGAGNARPGIVVDVHGLPNTVVTTGVQVENAHDQPAVVRCLVAASGGFGLVVEPTEIRLAPGESLPLVLRVTFPAVAPPGTATAGWLTVRGHGDADLVAQVRARVEP